MVVTPPTASAKKAGRANSSIAPWPGNKRLPLPKTPACARSSFPRAKAPIISCRILETLARLELTDGLDFSGLVREAAVQLPRDATVVAVFSHITPEMAQALGELVQHGFLVTAIVVLFGGEVLPDWARPPEWAEILLAQNINFHIVTSEEAVTNLCAQAIVR